MRLLVTRPMQDAVSLADALAAKGHDVLVSPLIYIEPQEADLPPPDTVAALALTSANGVKALAAACHTPAQFAAWQKIPAFAVGPQTAEALSAHGWASIKVAGGDVTALAALIKTHADSFEDKPVLHIAGRDRAGDLAAQLSAANIAHARAVLYRAEAADEFSLAAQAALSDADEPVDGVLVYSARSATLFCALYARLDDTPRNKPKAYCLSKSVAEIMQGAGFETVTAAQAEQAAMLALF